VNVANQFQQIGVFLTEDRLVPVLEQMTVAFMPPIKITGIAIKSRSMTVEIGQLPAARLQKILPSVARSLSKRRRSNRESAPKAEESTRSRLDYVCCAKLVCLTMLILTLKMGL